MTAIDARVRHTLADRIRERPLVLVVDSRPTVRQALLVTLDLLGFDVVVAADEVEALVSVNGVQPRALVVEASMWPATRTLVIDQVLERRDLRRLSVVVLGERPPGPAPKSRTSTLSIHHVPRDCDVNELLDLLEEMVVSDRRSTGAWGASR